MASSSSGTARGRKRNCRNWTELPDDITASILSRLGAIEILENAQKVCMKWRKVCKDPLMWRTIDMQNDGDLINLPYNLERMCRHAVDRSGGGLVDINIEYFGTDDLLKYITHRSTRIRRLRLACCESISDEGFGRVVSRLPLLEDLDISYVKISTNCIQAVGRCCPLFRSFKLNKEWFKFSDDESDDYYSSEEDDEPPAAYNKATDDSDAFAIAGKMVGLRHLQLFGNKMTDDGLRKILDCCPHLESLDLRHCFNLNFAGDLGIRCSEQIKKFWLPRDSIKGYVFAARYKWMELPDDITALILSRLGVVDILVNAQKVCMKWRRICKDSHMWRTIDMRDSDEIYDYDYDLEKMCRHAIDRSCGDLVDITISSFGTDEILKYITDRSKKIRRLRIVHCDGITDMGLIEVASELPLLEDLEFSVSQVWPNSLAVIGRSCPLLKSFKLNNEWNKYSGDEGFAYGSDYEFAFSQDYESDYEFAFSKDDDAIAIAETMHGLHDLQLFGNQLTNDGLRKILDGCPHLESLDLRYCFNLDLRGDLGRMCAERIKKLLLPNDSIAGYEFHPTTDSRLSSYKDDEGYERAIWDPYGGFSDSDW